MGSVSARTNDECVGLAGLLAACTLLVRLLLGEYFGGEMLDW